MSRRVGGPDPEARRFRGLVEVLLAERREVLFTARGRSMEPFIRDGDAVRVGPPGARLRRGDVVLCRGPHGGLLLHRVVRVDATHIVTRGDAATAEDAPAPRSSVIGRAAAVGGRRPLHLAFPFRLVPVVLPRRRRRAAAGVVALALAILSLA